jgi:hypothetical protein
MGLFPRLVTGLFPDESKYGSPNLYDGRGGLPGFESHDMYEEIPEKKTVQGLEQPTHPKNPTPYHRRYHHVSLQ